MAMPDLDTRRLQNEWMDDPSIDPHLHHEALVGLGRINWISRTVPRLWQAIRNMMGSRHSARILDIACGGGDVAIGLAKIAQQQGYHLDISVADLSPTALQFAQQHAQAQNISLHTFTHNALEGNWPDGPYDILINSLMLHHLNETDVITVLANMRSDAKLGIVVSDLLRTRWGWLITHYGVRLLTRCPVVHIDGPRSVEGAFTFDELHALAQQANLPGFTLKHAWPARAVLCWSRT